MFDITILNIDPNISLNTIGIELVGSSWRRRTTGVTGYIYTDKIITDQEQLTLLNQIYKYTGISEIWLKNKSLTGFYDYDILFHGGKGKIRFWDDTGDMYRITVYREGDTHDISYNR